MSTHQDTMPTARRPVSHGAYRVHPSYMIVLETARRTLEGASTDRDDNRRVRLQAVATKWIRTTCRAVRGETTAVLALDAAQRTLPTGDAERFARMNTLSHHVCQALSLGDLDAARVDLDALITALTH
jgi:hypothetical protein